jgi:intein-encoded DNA endonuclease-like protein
VTTIGELAEKRKVTFSKTPEIAYVIGVILGDGSAYITKRKQYVVKLETISEDFAEEFYRCLRAVLGKGRMHRNKRGYFEVYAYSKDLVLLVKDKTRLLEYIEVYPLDFIRGFYDSEGSYIVQGRAEKIYIANTDYWKIELVRELLERHSGIRAKIYTLRRGGGVYYILSITRKDDVTKFIRAVKPTIRRDPHVYKVKLFEKICANCGRVFRVDPSHKDQIFCSRKCFYEWEHGENNPNWRSVRRVCARCGREFYIPLSTVRKGGGVYCSNECRRMG